MKTPPQRAVTLAVKIGADTRDEMITALRVIMDNIARGEMTTGCSGGYGSGWTYEYREADRPTHEEYVEKIAQYLRQENENANG